MLGSAKEILEPLLFLLLLAVVFFSLQKAFPLHLKQKFFRPGFRLDLTYWLFGQFFILVIAFMLSCVIAFISIAIPEIGDERAYLNGWNSIIKVAYAVIALDFAGYWVHRIFHSRKWWPFHAIHHSSVEIDWLSSIRFHPLESLMIALIQYGSVVAICGFSLETATFAGLIRSIYGYFVHSNLKLRFGPLEYIFATPYYHHWHHTREKEGMNKNFGGVFSFWDLAFGTMYLPKNKKPYNLGISHNLDDNFIAHLLFPFKTKRR